MKKNIKEKLDFYSNFGDNFSLNISIKEMKEILKLINKPVETTNEEPKLSILEYTYLREALYTLRKSDSFSAYQAKEYFNDDNVLTNMINKFRRFMV